MTIERPRDIDGAVVGMPVAGHSAEPTTDTALAPPRLARYRLRLASGADVGVAVSGRGVPLVVVHGFAAEGILYAQTLSRLVEMGFKVIAIDSPGHGGTDSVGLNARFDAYADLLRDTLDHLGVRRAVLAGHSMGGRIVVEFAAADPGRVIAVVLIDAIVGDPWDRMTGMFRFAPLTYAAFGLGLLADTISTLPLTSDPAQALKLARLVFPTGANHVRRPWRLAGPLLAILRSGRSTDRLDRLRDHGVPTFFVHGDRDVLVPPCTAREAAQRTGGELVVVHGARHSWLLRDPETFPAIVRQLRDRGLGDAIASALAEHGLTAEQVTAAQMERALYDPDAVVVGLTPEDEAAPGAGRHRAPRYRWTHRGPTRSGAGR